MNVPKCETKTKKRGERREGTGREKRKEQGEGGLKGECEEREREGRTVVGTAQREGGVAVFVFVVDFLFFLFCLRLDCDELGR
jgi:hypothetical protein